MFYTYQKTVNNYKKIEQTILSLGSFLRQSMEVRTADSRTKKFRSFNLLYFFVFSEYFVTSCITYLFDYKIDLIKKKKDIKGCVRTIYFI